MNRFRTKKKTKEVAEGVVRGSTDSDGPSVPALKTSKTFRLGRKQPEPEQRLELDLANALPPSDDFRTSLLMSGLSARFSMLREQDDPKSKIGKASDDSVLFPTKRQSRMNDFTFQGGLSDIAEVASINGSIRPPFAYSRRDSNGTDDGSTNGSIMNRSKPGEGNILFGGRQKIYKIAVDSSGSSKSPTDGSSAGMGGRALYGDDVNLSAFQKLRQREKEQQQQEAQEEADESLQTARSNSPPFSGYNRNRETSSTTSSGGPSITRSSTAATSFTSQRTPSLSGAHTPASTAPSTNESGMTRTLTKGRRLYETGLDQHLHEQQFSAMNRIDTLTRQRTHGAQTPPPGLTSPILQNHPADRWEQRHPIQGKASMPNMRAASPSPTTAQVGHFDFGVRTNSNGEMKQAYGMAAPPLSPPVSEHDEHNVLKVQPNDRGKATALGTFSKPAQPYDENKYTQRQLQMQQGRETPPLRRHSPPRAFVPQQPVGRNRADSKATFASNRSRSSSSAHRQHFNPHDRIQETTLLPATVSEDQAINAGVFLSSPNGSSYAFPRDVDQEPKHPIKPFDLYNKYRQEPQANLQRPPESQHPAHRQRPFEPQDTMLMDPSPTFPTSNPRVQVDLAPEPSKVATPADSPTLGPTSGLSGMVRQHLRSDSNASSVYGGMPSAGLVSRFPHDPEPMPHNDYSTKNNPWDNEEWDQSQSDYDGNNFHLESALNGSKTDNVMPKPLTTRSPNVESAQVSRDASWQRELEIHHRRDGSTETQKEQRDFANDLAARRRRVQENLKSFVETESRSTSPMPGSEWNRDTPQARTNALGLLKTKTSRGSLVGRPKEPTQSKAMKMLGIGNTTITSSPSPGKSTFDENSWKQEEEEMLRGVSNGTTLPPQTKAFRQARRDAQRDRERQVTMRHQQRLAAEATESAWSSSPVESPQPQMEPSRDRVPTNIRTRHRTPSRERGPPPVANSHRNGSSESQGSVTTSHSGSRSPSRVSRDRSSSDASGARSKSRNGRYKDDLAKAMAEGTASSSQTTLDEPILPSMRFMPSPATSSKGFQPSPNPSPLIGAHTGSRSRANSKPPTPGYFDNYNLQPIQTGMEIDIGVSPRPSPVTPFSINSTPSLPQPAPAAGSGCTTPTTQGFQSQGRIPANRKKSINKSDISEPQFVSSTSRITTVNLPPGSSLRNGSETNAPPIPPVNPRRKTRAMFGFGRKDDEEFQSNEFATQSTEEMSTFSADESEFKPKRDRQRLRKSSSEGGNLNARAKQAILAAPSPALPSQFPAGSGSPPRRQVEGGMF